MKNYEAFINREIIMLSYNETRIDNQDTSVCNADKAWNFLVTFSPCCFIYATMGFALKEKRSLSTSTTFHKSKSKPSSL